MITKAWRLIHARTVLCLCLALLSCAPTPYLKTEEVNTVDLTDTFTLILHGCRYGDDRENVALLVREGYPYPFQVYAPPFDYRMRTSLPAEEAFGIAEQFIRCHHSFRTSKLSRIVDRKGGIFGYELKALYLPLDVGFSDVLDTRYWFQDGKVIIWIRLKPELEMQDNESPLLFRGIMRMR
jgi:hypothetical protein